MGRWGHGTWKNEAVTTTGRAVFILALAILFSGCAVSPGWREVPGKGGPVWRSESGGWRAEVDPSRGRLSYLGPSAGPNLLYSPAEPPDSLQMGGHRVWLGPQFDWKPFWPPPRNWEMMPAESIKLRAGNLLEVESPGGVGEAVAIRRTYRWRGDGRLECGVSWQETSDRGRQAIQIFQVDAAAVVEAHPAPGPSAPRGFVRLPLAGRPTTETIFAFPRQAKVALNRVFLRRGREEEKLGFPEQTLFARWPVGQLRLHPGRINGRVVGDPDGGFPTQIYLGAHDWPVLEVEQLSPRLLPWLPGGRVSHTVLVELRRP